MIKRICKNCVYFHVSPDYKYLNKIHDVNFGICRVNISRDVKKGDDKCEDFSTEDIIYHANKSMPKKGIFARFRDLLIDIKNISEAQLEYWDKEWEKMRGVKKK